MAEQRIALLSDERWWGGLATHGAEQPYTAASEAAHDLRVSHDGNQAAPLLISDAGRVIWSEEPFGYRFAGGELIVDGAADLRLEQPASDLRGAFRAASQNYFPPDGELPHEQLFTLPQYNTWIELQYNHNQTDILAYARRLIDEGYPPGVLMIDDTWQEDYGVWNFHPGRFPDPKAMMDELHALGFVVMVWIVPYISPDSLTYRQLAAAGLLVMQRGEHETIEWANTSNWPALMRWWNGASGVLDLSHPDAVAWLQTQLDRLQEDYGVDGFKFDGGDAQSIKPWMEHSRPTPGYEHSRLFAELGLRYRLNEYRASWKVAGKALAQRLKDKKHNWDDLRQLIPCGLAQGLLGYAFTCPDMIGGGEYLTFLPGAPLDPELMVRSAQCSALFPMMQYSVAPWRVLDAEHAELCRAAARLHEELGAEILALARAAAADGEPIMRHLAYVFPDGGFGDCADQFMLGDDILVAPVLEQGARERRVRFPAGTWASPGHEMVNGPCEQVIAAPLERLPWWRRV